MKKIKLVYIIGPAYSGSTLLGLLLGKTDEGITLGEVSNLENDFNSAKVCTCGTLVKDCTFWSTIVNSEELKREGWGFDNGRYRHKIDQRGGWEKIPLVLGVKPKSLYGKEMILKYEQKQQALFRAVIKNNDLSYIVDLSKQAERLDILLNDNSLDIYCIHLRRDLKQVFASTLARPKRTRSKFGFKVLREAIWLNLRTLHEKRILRDRRVEHVFNLSFNDFTKDPDKHIIEILEWLNVSSSQNYRSVNIKEQHLYVGNRWLFKRDTDIVEVKPSRSARSLTRMQAFTFNTIALLMGNYND